MVGLKLCHGVVGLKLWAVLSIYWGGGAKTMGSAFCPWGGGTKTMGSAFYLLGWWRSIENNDVMLHKLKEHSLIF